VQFDRKDIRMNKLLTAGLDSKMSIFDLRTQHKEHGFASVTTICHKSTIWCGAHLPQNRDIFMTAGGNGSLHLWKYKYPGKRVEKMEDGTEQGVAGDVIELNRVSSSTQPIFSFEWSADKEGLCLTTAADQTLRVMIVTRLNKQ
jgi:WD40 repeat protein